MSRVEGFQTCPHCLERASEEDKSRLPKTLPRIDPNSKANAVMCQNQNCRAVITRKELEEIAERARLKAIEDAKKKAAKSGTQADLPSKPSTSAAIQPQKGHQ